MSQINTIKPSIHSLLFIIYHHGGGEANHSCHRERGRKPVKSNNRTSNIKRNLKQRNPKHLFLMHSVHFSWFYLYLSHVPQFNLTWEIHW